jgi:ABC-type lipoprotein export system ATPase subunit
MPAVFEKSFYKKDFIKMLHHFKKFKQGILVITHDKELIQILDEIIQL